MGYVKPKLAITLKDANLENTPSDRGCLAAKIVVSQESSEHPRLIVRSTTWHLSDSLANFGNHVDSTS
jgi:hypothetical protein